MNIKQIDNHPLTGLEMSPRGLRKEEVCFQVAANQIVPLRLGYAAYRCRVEGRGVVYEDIEPATPFGNSLH